jgi:predicted DsbA family dithiol-disulfide isomerase
VSGLSEKRSGYLESSLRVSAESKKEGLDFNFSAITRQPNTLKSPRPARRCAKSR